ncbi:MAG: phage holin, LLH family [Clostridia bacterium]
MQIDLTEIITVILTLISAIVTGFVIPLINQSLSTAKQEKLRFWVNTAVQAAEQLFGGDTGEEKKEYVVSFLLSKGIVVDVDEVSALIESEVYKLTSSLGSTATDTTEVIEDTAAVEEITAEEIVEDEITADEIAADEITEDEIELDELVCELA